MRSLLYPIMALLMVSLFTACDKDTTQPDEQSLTGCPVNFTCEYTFSIPPLTTAQQVIAFNYNRSQKSNCELQYKLQFNAVVSNGQIELNSSDIPNSSTFNTICACCDFYPIKPLSGHITGKQINDDKWLIDANVVLGDANSGKAMDTIKVKQYFIKK